MFKAEIKGLDATLRRIESYSKELADKVDIELNLAATSMATEAKVLAPRGKTGLLSSLIYADISKRYDKRVVSPAPYAAYVEFGTGINVFKNKTGFTFTPAMKAYAKEFYVNGMGRCPAQPYFFPAYTFAVNKLLKNLRSIFSKRVKP